MPRELTRALVDLVRTEAGYENDQKKYSDLAQTAARLAVETALASSDERSAWQDYLEQLRQDMKAKFLQLLYASPNNQFRTTLSPKNEAGGGYRNVDVESMGEFEVAKVPDFIPVDNDVEIVTKYRLAVVNLPAGFSASPPLSHNPVIAQFYDRPPLHVEEMDLEDLQAEATALYVMNDRLQDICQAAGLIEPEDEA
jgi:hypothetical protein